MTILSDTEITRLCEMPDCFHMPSQSLAIRLPVGYKLQQQAYGHWATLNNAGTPVSHTVDDPAIWSRKCGDENELLGTHCSLDEIETHKHADWFKQRLAEFRKPMIEPFVPHQVKTKTDPYPSSTGEDDAPRRIISYGLSSYGYDLRVGRQFKIFTNVNSSIIDPKNFDDKSFVDFEGDCCIIPPNSFVLASSLEYMRLPRNVTGIVLGKSTYARCGISCLATPLEAGWEGHVTLEFANTTPLPAKLYAEEGACQVQFFEGRIPCEVSYSDRVGKYMRQEAGPVTPRV